MYLGAIICRIDPVAAHGIVATSFGLLAYKGDVVQKTMAKVSVKVSGWDGERSSIEFEVACASVEV